MTAAAVGFAAIRKTPVARRPARARPRALPLGLALTASAAMWMAIIAVVVTVV